MSTPALTLADFDGKFNQVKSQITPEVLDLVNRSETMKGLVRNYESDIKTTDVIIDTKNSTTSIFEPSTDTAKAYISLGADRIKGVVELLKDLSHELGHHDVEKPGGIISNARTNAWDTYQAERTRIANESGNQNPDSPDGIANNAVLNAARADFNNACNLTEGHARMATGKSFDEMLSNTNGMSGQNQHRLGQNHDLQEFQKLRAGAIESSWTAEEVERGMAYVAYAMGDSNKTASNSFSNESYFQFCKKETDRVFQSGSTQAGGVAPAAEMRDSESGSSITVAGGSESRSASYVQTAEGKSECTFNFDNEIVRSKQSFTDEGAKYEMCYLDQNEQLKWREVLLDRNLDGISEQGLVQTPDGVTAFYDGTGASVGRMQTLDEQPTATPLPTPTSLSDTLNYSRALFESETDYANAAYGMRSLVGLECRPDDEDTSPPAGEAVAFDSNADGLLDERDTSFADFRIWQDGNGNGESDEGELKTLSEAGILSVGLAPARVDYESGGNRILGFSSFTRVGGETGWAADVAFGFEGEGAAVSENNGYLEVDQRGSLIYAVGTGSALNLELAANALEGALGSAGFVMLAHRRAGTKSVSATRRREPAALGMARPYSETNTLQATINTSLAI